MCFEGQCSCVPAIGLVDCSSAGLKTVPGSSEILRNFTILSLRSNYLKAINITAVKGYLPDLEIVDLQNNSTMKCERIFVKAVQLLTDCSNLSTATHFASGQTTPEINNTIFTPSSSYATIYTASSTDLNASVLPNLDDRNDRGTVYITTLTMSLVFTLIIIIFTRIIVKLHTIVK